MDSSFRSQGMTSAAIAMQMILTTLTNSQSKRKSEVMLLRDKTLSRTRY